MLGSVVACSGLHASAQSCGEALEGALRVDSPAYALAFRTQPDRIEVGRHFTVELIVCAKAGAGAADVVHVDGFMPEHGHGMNYKAAVTPLGEGRYRAEGLMFHMPGRWDFIFDLRAAGKTERLKRNRAMSRRQYAQSGIAAGSPALLPSYIRDRRPPERQ